MSCHFQHHPNRNPVYTNTTQIIDPIFPPSSNNLTNHQNPSTQNFPITSDQIIKIHLRTANPISSIWFRMEIPYPYWKVCLGGMLRRYASGFASGVCFGVCFAWTSSHGTYFISKRLPTNFPTFYISLCISLHIYLYNIDTYGFLV